MFADPYASGVLDQARHHRLVADLDRYAKVAGIQPHWVWTPMGSVCSDVEKDYVRRFRFHAASEDVRGICYVGKNAAVEVQSRMAALVGCLLRNFVSARLVTLVSLLDELHTNNFDHPSCLLVPNFFIPKNEGGSVAPWQLTALQDLLMHRALSGEQTVIYATDLSALGVEYGTAIAQLIKNRFKIIKV